MVKLINRMRRKQEAAPAAPAPTPEDIALLREIRDELSAQKLKFTILFEKRHKQCRFYVPILFWHEFFL